MEIFNSKNLLQSMKHFIQKDFRPPILSLYLSTSTVWQENEKSKIKLKNLLNKVKDYLRGVGMKASDVDRLLAPMQDLLGDDVFWKNTGEAVAFFKTFDDFEYISLPENVEAQFYASDIPNIKPLSFYLLPEQRYYVLALSLKEVRLFRALNKSWERTDPIVMPENMKETLRTHDVQEHVQAHPSGPQGARGRPAYREHGHGEQDSTKDEQIKVFIDEVDWALNHFITDLENEKKPLVILAADENIVNFFRKHTKYPNLSGKFIKGNPEGKKPKELINSAWEIALKRVTKARKKMIEKYKEHKTSQKAVEGVEEVGRAAFENRVDALFVDPKETVWGSYSVEERRIQKDKEQLLTNHDLINWIVVKSLLSDAKIVALSSAESISLDTESPAAILRFSA